MENEKIKVTSIEIIVEGEKENPYFEIKYREVGKNYNNIGYGSFCLDNVLEWRDNCFEVVKRKKSIFKKIFGL